MAAIVNTNSFLVTTSSRSRLSSKSSRSSISAKKSGSFPNFQLGKQKDDPAPADAGNKPFGFSFGKGPDFKSLVPVVSNPSVLQFGASRRKEQNTVFVAGATGQAGIHIARTLLRQGFSVRAGVPDLRAAQELAVIATNYKLISKDDAKRLNAVESSFQNAESIAKAIGPASKVVVTLGSSENGPDGEVSPMDAANVVKASALAGVSHVTIICDTSSENTSTYNVIDGFTSFFNNIFAKKEVNDVPELLQKVVETNINYTVIKARLSDEFSPENSFNLALSAEGRAPVRTDYKVSKSQIASLVASVFSNTEVAENKVVEVFTDPAAPSQKIDDLFRSVPEDKRRKIYAETVAKAKAEEAAAAATKKLEAAEPRKEANRAKAAAAEEAEEEEEEESKIPGVNEFLNKAKDMGSSFSWEKFTSQIRITMQNETEESEEPKVRVATVRGQAKARSLPSQKAVAKTPAFGRRKEEAKAKANGNGVGQKGEVRSVLGGLFKQETIYVDDE